MTRRITLLLIAGFVAGTGIVLFNGKFSRGAADSVAPQPAAASANPVAAEQATRADASQPAPAVAGDRLDSPPLLRHSSELDERSGGRVIIAKVNGMPVLAEIHEKAGPPSFSAETIVQPVRRLPCGPMVEHLAKVLDQPIEVNCTELGIEQLDAIFLEAGVFFVVDPRLSASRPEGATAPITFITAQRPKTTLRGVMQLWEDVLDSRFVVRDYGVILTSAKVAELPGSQSAVNFRCPDTVVFAPEATPVERAEYSRERTLNSDALDRTR